MLKKTPAQPPGAGFAPWPWNAATRFCQSPVWIFPLLWGLLLSGTYCFIYRSSRTMCSVFSIGHTKWASGFNVCCAACLVPDPALCMEQREGRVFLSHRQDECVHLEKKKIQVNLGWENKIRRQWYTKDFREQQRISEKEYLQ